MCIKKQTRLRVVAGALFRMRNGLGWRMPRGGMVLMDDPRARRAFGRRAGALVVVVRTQRNRRVSDGR